MSPWRAFSFSIVLACALMCIWFAVKQDLAPFIVGLLVTIGNLYQALRGEALVTRKKAKLDPKEEKARAVQDPVEVSEGDRWRFHYRRLPEQPPVG